MRSGGSIIAFDGYLSLGIIRLNAQLVSVQPERSVEFEYNATGFALQKTVSGR